MNQTPSIAAVIRRYCGRREMDMKQRAIVGGTEWGQIPLLWAARNGHNMIVKRLLVKNVNLELKDKIYGQTLLSWAVYNRHEGTVKLLLSTDINLKSKDKLFS
ncbi:ankyrin repeat protein [Penicillium cosmopolitanum]|uniref:Ankyrin repeat protein n=1 Tax=Penicillium cosmopolitanum TaxID=1131564 RepID=A0A9W9W0G4_9EURO|nr:ankyrin repeat protein [Penicillium cosmopolitanum]KAJ5392671.1 ankyrin repeat protein [Penicillium cosmopolitanum]